MANQFDLKQALEQLQREIQRETGELHAKQAAMTALDAEKIKLENENKVYLTEKKTKETELLELVRKIGQAEKRIAEIKREHPKLEDEVRRKTADLNDKDKKLREHQESLRNALAKPK
jgi:chromosome segregation ATPase